MPNAFWHRMARASEAKALNSENNARSLVTSRFPDAKTMRIPSKSVVKSSSSGQSGSMRWDDSYLYLMTTQGWKRVPLNNF
mgnify:CR=1 FL=1